VTAVASRLLRYGHTATFTADERLIFNREPDVWGHVHRDGRWHWRLTAWRTGRELASGETRTGWGAWRRARAAAYRPGLLQRSGGVR
jgi:hypothetical protein